MGTITARKRKDGSVGYRARVRVMRDGQTYHETETFDRRPPATAWMKQRERELAKPGVIDSVKSADPTLAKAIDRYTEESIKEIGRTKAQVLKAIKKFPIADMACSTIKSKDIIEFLQSLTSQPQTVGNYASHLAAIFAIARPMWDYRLDDREMKDAITVARRMGIISRSLQRDRRPTLEELDKLLGHFIERRKRAPQAMPMQLFGQNEFNQNVQIDQVTCGLLSTAAITSNGELFMWGKNRYGALGVEFDEDAPMPMRVFVPARVTSVSLGPDHTFALCKGYV